jgi:hypothetical protein
MIPIFDLWLFSVFYFGYMSYTSHDVVSHFSLATCHLPLACHLYPVHVRRVLVSRVNLYLICHLPLANLPTCHYSTRLSWEESSTQRGGKKKDTAPPPPPPPPSVLFVRPPCFTWCIPLDGFWKRERVMETTHSHIKVKKTHGIFSLFFFFFVHQILTLLFLSLSPNSRQAPAFTSSPFICPHRVGRLPLAACAKLPLLRTLLVPPLSPKLARNSLRILSCIPFSESICFLNPDNVSRNRATSFSLCCNCSAVSGSIS